MSTEISSKAWKEIHPIYIGNKQDISPWQTDPRVALMRRHKIGLVMVPPVGLDQFISPAVDAMDEVQFIHGPKGSGKTSLLLAKRCLLERAIEDREVLCVPNGFPYVFSPNMDSTTTINFETWESLLFADKETWKYVWLVLLGTFLLNALDIDSRQVNTELDNSHAALLSDKLKKFVIGERGAPLANLDESQWVEYLKNLIENTRAQNSTRFKAVYETEILPHLLAIAPQSRPIFLFVDGVDETFTGPGGSPLMKLVKSNSMRSALDANDQKRPPIDSLDRDPNLLARKIWVNAQTSLIGVATELSSRTSGKVCLFGSMRSEAYREMTNHSAQAVGQFANLIKAIEYTKEHLESIFMANVLASLPKKRTQNVIAVDADVDRFFGLRSFRVHQVGISESMFQYLCRHTLDEPRDLMIIGLKFKGQQVAAQGNEHRIADIVKKSTHEILDDYFKFMDEEWDSNIEATVLPLIWKNVLTLDEANEIANQTAIDHPLCYLYKRGLIGVVEMSDTGRLMQVFQRAAVANEGNRSSMPVSAAYLVHPLLESRILNARANASKGKFQLVPGMVVGNGLKWNPSARTKQVSIKLKSGRVVLLINRTDLSASISETVSGSFTTLAEVPTSMLIACLLAMLEENTNTPSIQDVLDKMKEFIDAGYLSQKKKSKGQVVLMMTYLSECLKGERYPTLFETINDRLTAIGLVETKITRFKKTSAMAVTGFSWNEIELIME